MISPQTNHRSAEAHDEVVGSPGSPLHTVGRIVVTGCILVAGWWTAQTFRAMLLDAPASPIVSAPVDPPPLAASQSLKSGGGWSFAGMNWQVSFDELDTTHLMEHLTLLPADDEIPADLQTSKHMLDAVRQFGAVSIEAQGGFSLHHLDRGGIRVAVVGRLVDDVERVVLIRCAMLGESSAWSMMTARPERNSGSRPAEAFAGPSLLPLPPSSESLCRRTDGAGRILLEASQVSVPVDAVLDLWQAEGWSLERADFDEGDAPIVCRRGDDTVLVWFSEAEMSGHLLACRSEVLGATPLNRE